MNQFGIYFTYWADRYNTDYGAYISRAAALGFDTLGVRASGIVDMPAVKRLELKRQADDAGIRLTYGIGFPAQYDLTSAEVSTRNHAVEYAEKVLQAVHSMDGRLLNGVYYSSWPGALPQGVRDKRPYLQRSMAGMEKISLIAEDLGITCCLEVVNRYEGFLLNTAAEARDYVDELNRPNVMILLDTFHMSIEEARMAEAIVTAGDRLGHFHAGENNRDVPGKGMIDWREIAGALRDINYQGIIELEPFVKMGCEIGTNVRVWRDISRGADEARLDANAKNALDFLKSCCCQGRPGGSKVQSARKDCGGVAVRENSYK